MSCSAGSVIHRISEGDTFMSLSLRYGSSVDAITEANPDLDPQNLIVGQLVCIPPPETVFGDCESGNLYVVRLGDTLFAIAGVFGVSVDEILYKNPSVSPDSLYIGQILCIPVAPSPITIDVSLASHVMTVRRNGLLQKRYLVAVGKPETPSPEGRFTIINKAVDPGGPYGTRWMALSERGYGIHGTNDPASIGSAASNGCIRMFNSDVEELFSITPVGTPVTITQ